VSGFADVCVPGIGAGAGGKAGAWVQENCSSVTALTMLVMLGV
jgi:hypothetical protein